LFLLFSEYSLFIGAQKNNFYCIGRLFVLFTQKYSSDFDELSYLIKKTRISTVDYFFLLRSATMLELS